MEGVKTSISGSLSRIALRQKAHLALSGRVAGKQHAFCADKLAAKPARSQFRVFAAEKANPAPTSEDVEDHYINQFCNINKGVKKTQAEMEQEFLLALQSFYIDGSPIMSNEEFDNLKEELLWAGSAVAILSPDEQKFMEASLAYQVAGKSFLSDEEYDDLKLQLKKQGSKLAIAGPRCSIRSKKVISDSEVDYLRMTLLNVPAALIALTAVFLVDDLSGFEITYLLELPEPYSFLFTWFVVLPGVFLIASSLTGLIFKDFLILKGPCPSCGATNVSFFGSILGIQTDGKENAVKCESCGSNLSFKLDTRHISLEPPSPPKKAKVAATGKA